MTEQAWDWQCAIVDACSEPSEAWMAAKFIGNLRDHAHRYPAFKPERVADMFLDAPPKTRAWMCYQPVSKFTKSIHKANSFRSFAASQS